MPSSSSRDEVLNPNAKIRSIGSIRELMNFSLREALLTVTMSVLLSPYFQVCLSFLMAQGIGH